MLLIIFHFQCYKFHLNAFFIYYKILFFFHHHQMQNKNVFILICKSFINKQLKTLITNHKWNENIVVFIFFMLFRRYAMLLWDDVVLKVLTIFIGLKSNSVFLGYVT